jgi:hypothetical protein
MARKDRHTFLMGGEADGFDLESLSRAIREAVVSLTLMWRTSCDQFFSSTLLGGDRPTDGRRACRGARPETDSFLKGLILAQNERWRRGLGMQVERVRSQDRASGARVSKATVTNPMVGHSRGKLRVIPSDVRGGHPLLTKAQAPWDGPSWY